MPRLTWYALARLRHRLGRDSGATPGNYNPLRATVNAKGVVTDAQDGDRSSNTTKGDLTGHDGVDDVRVPVGTDGQVLEADSAESAGVAWKTPSAAGLPTTTKGDVIAHDGTSDKRLPVGTDGQVLEADSGASLGVSWQTPAAGGGAVPLGFSGAGSTIAKGSTDYVGIGSGGVQSTEADAEFYVSRSGTVQNLRTYVSANASNNGGNTVTVRKNGAGAGITVTYAASETGAKSDLVNTVSVVAGDRLTFEVVNAGSGGGTKNLVLASASIEIA